jgi:hypothetical protein
MAHISANGTGIAIVPWDLPSRRFVAEKEGPRSTAMLFRPLMPQPCGERLFLRCLTAAFERRRRAPRPAAAQPLVPLPLGVAPWRARLAVEPQWRRALCSCCSSCALGKAACKLAMGLTRRETQSQADDTSGGHLMPCRAIYARPSRSSRT